MPIRHRATRISASLPRPELEAWKAKMGAERAREIMVAAGRRGSAFHNYVEAVLLGQRPPGVSEEIVAMAKLTLDWLEAWEVFEVEMVVWSSTLPLAGTVDVWAKSRETGRHALIDFKTSKSIWDSHAIQQVVYADIMDRALVDRTGDPGDYGGATGTAIKWFGPPDLILLHVAADGVKPYTVSYEARPKLLAAARTGYDAMIWQAEKKEVNLWR